MITQANNIDLEKSEQTTGWADFQGDRLQARIYNNNFWHIKGSLDEKFPIDEFRFDPLTLTWNHPTDFEGKFNGTIGRGRISLGWEKSGATIIGGSPVGDFEVKGQTTIDWSP